MIVVLFMVIYISYSIYWITKKEKVGGEKFSTGYLIKIIRALIMMIGPTAIYFRIRLSDGLFFMAISALIFAIPIFNYLCIKILYKKILCSSNHDANNEIRKDIEKRMNNIKISFAICFLYALIMLSVVFLPN